MKQRQGLLWLVRPWLAILGLAILAAGTAIELTRLALEANGRSVLALEAQRRADDVTGQTLNGNVMGSVANLGLVNLAVKGAAQGTVSPTDSLLLDTLEGVGRLYDASGVFVVDAKGVIRASWDEGGKSSNALDVGFRPYFQIAMKGQRNVYAAVSLSTGQRSLYFAAPLFSKVSLSADPIGAAVARLSLNRVDSVLKTWNGHALLLSPQNIVFAADTPGWVGRVTSSPSEDQLKAIRGLKQFGSQFETGVPEVLPFSLLHHEISLDGHRYGVASSPVQWNDPAGPWSLVLLGDLDEILPPLQAAEIGLGCAAIVVVLGGLFLAWRTRLSGAQALRKSAEADLLIYSRKLEADGQTKSFLVDLSAELHRAQDTTAFARVFFHATMPRLGAESAAFYVHSESTGRLEPVGGHGVLAQALPSYEIGQGLVGQCAKELRPLHPAEATGSPLRVSWGGGDAVPCAVSLWPVHQVGHLLGVVVIASQARLSEEQLAFIDEVLPMVAMNLEILGRNAKTQDLLQKSQRQAVEMISQTAELKASAENLSRNRAVTTALLNAIPDVIYFKDPEGVYLGCNEAYGTMLGRPPEAIVGKTDFDLYPREIAEYFRSDDEAVLQLPEGRSQEEWVDFADGRHLLLDTVKRPFWDDQGQLLGLLSISRDITERQQEKERLDREREKLQEILDASPLGVGITVGGVARMLNPMLRTMIDAEVGRSISEAYVDADEREKILELLKGQRVVRDVEVKFFNRERKPCRMLVTYMRMDYQNESGILVWMLNVTEAKAKKGVTRGKN